MSLELESQSTCSVQNWDTISKEKPFIQLPRAILVYLLTDKNLSQTDKFVWLFLSTYTFVNPKTRELSFSSAQIGKGIDRSGPTVTESLKTLHKTGYIKLENSLRADKSYSKHKITVLFPDAAIQQIKDGKQHTKNSIVSTKNENATENNAPMTQSNIIFGHEIRFSVKGYQIPEMGYRNFEIINNNPPIGSSLIKNNVNTVAGDSDTKHNGSLSQSTSFVENVFLNETSLAITEEQYDLPKIQKVNDVFHEQYKTYCAMGKTLQEAVKLSDEHISDEDRITLTKAACAAYVQYGKNYIKNISEGINAGDSRLKAKTNLSVLEQDLLAEYLCEDLDYQTRLDRNLANSLTKEFRNKFNIQQEFIGEPQEGVTYKKTDNFSQEEGVFEEKLLIAEKIYQDYHKLYQEQLKVGIVDEEAKKQVRKNIHQSDKEFLIEIATVINDHYKNSLRKLPNGMNFVSKDIETRKQLSLFEQILLNEYLNGAQYTLLGLSMVEKTERHSVVKVEDKPLEIVKNIDDSSGFTSDFKDNIDADMLGRIIGWLFVMKKKGEISKGTTDKQMKRWIEEVAYHAVHWQPTNEQYKNLEKREKMKIAISFACRSIRQGTWKTPYGLVTREIIQREIEANNWKEKELAEIKKVSNFKP
jgi:hypothetical protein